MFNLHVSVCLLLSGNDEWSVNYIRVCMFAIKWWLWMFNLDVSVCLLFSGDDECKGPVKWYQFINIIKVYITMNYLLTLQIILVH